MRQKYFPYSINKAPMPSINGNSILETFLRLIESLFCAFKALIKGVTE